MVVFEYRTVKCLGDSVAALLLITLTIPVWLIALLGLASQNRLRALFFQDRPGLNGKVFKIVKFKTMTDARDANGQLLPDSERLTYFGKFVRSLSIDELPQLLNVLKGDMSLVGPRPLLVQYLSRYSKEQARRHEVKPGITGWAQVNGRNAISWEEKFRLDVEYVDQQSFALDVKILYLTLIKVFKREGISANGEATMSEFRGSSAVGKSDP
jgi:lipopolysaccharide/colanic/teichoic acid biosynthesis glycosyltransferase